MLLPRSKWHQVAVAFPRLGSAVATAMAASSEMVGPAADAGLDAPYEGRSYQCVACKKYFFQSGVLINQERPGFDWQGGLNLNCFACSDFQNARDFKKVVQRGWSTRKRELGENVSRRVRSVSFLSAKDDIEREAGEPRREYRRRVLQATAEFAASIRAGFEKATPDQHSKMSEALNAWATDLESKAHIT